MTEITTDLEKKEDLQAGFKDEITLSQTMSRADYSALRAYYMYQIHKGRIRNLVIAFVISAALTGLGKAEYLPEFLYGAGACGLVVLAYLFIWIDGQAKKLEKPGKSIGNRPQVLTLSEEGFRVEWLNHGTALTYKWDAVILAAETDCHIFLFVNKLAAIIIPKRGVKPEKLTSVLHLIERKRELVRSFDKKGKQSE